MNITERVSDTDLLLYAAQDDRPAVRAMARELQARRAADEAVRKHLEAADLFARQACRPGDDGRGDDAFDDTRNRFRAAKADPRLSIFTQIGEKK